MISVLILEDVAILRNQLIRTLNDWHFVSKVFACESNVEAKKNINKYEIDLLLADLNVADGDGVETIKYFADQNPNKAILVISAISKPERIISAIQAGAIGYIHKSDSSIEIKHAIEKVLDGQSPISADIANTLCLMLQTAEIRKPRTNEKGILTDREFEVIDLIARGLSNAEISSTLSLSVNTVPVHVRNIYKKLHASNRSEAIYEARAMGIL